MDNMVVSFLKENYNMNTNKRFGLLTQKNNNNVCLSFIGYEQVSQGLASK